jgi:methyl-accepting chemotaxis protein
MALNYEKLTIEFYLVLFLLTVFVFFFGFAIGQSFASPIKKLLNKAVELSGGNLSSRAYLETKDELAELASVFNKIAQELEESRILQRETEKSVDIKVKARTQALEETINALEQKVKNRTIEMERIIDESEKLHEKTKIKEVEIAELKEEIKKLKEKLEKSSSRRTISKRIKK